MSKNLALQAHFIDTQVEIKQGYLCKQSRSNSFFKNWKRRYCVIEQGIFSYYENQSDEYPYGSSLKGTMNFKNAVVMNNICPVKEKHKIFIKSRLSDENNLVLDAGASENALEWIAAIRKHIDYANGKYQSFHKKSQHKYEEYSISAVVDEHTVPELWNKRISAGSNVSNITSISPAHNESTSPKENNMDSAQSRSATITSLTTTSSGSWSKHASREHSVSPRPSDSTAINSNRSNSSASQVPSMCSAKSTIRISPNQRAITTTQYQQIQPQIIPMKQMIPPPPPPPPISPRIVCTPRAETEKADESLTAPLPSGKLLISATESSILCQICFSAIDSNDVTKFSLFNGCYHFDCIKCSESCDCHQVSYYFLYTKANEERDDQANCYCGHFVDYICAEAIQKVFRGFKSRKVKSKQRLKVFSKMNDELARKVKLKQQLQHHQPSSSALSSSPRLVDTAATATVTSSSKTNSLIASIASSQIGRAIDLEGQSYNIFSEFKEFSKKQLDEYAALFAKYDTEGRGKINLEGFKRMMEKLGLPQTHLKLKQLMQEVDSDKYNMISLRDFLLLFRKRRKGELLSQSFTDVINIFESSINVSETGVADAAKFFESKARLTTMSVVIEGEVKKEASLNKIKKLEKIKKKEDFMVKRSAVGDFLTTNGMRLPPPAAAAAETTAYMYAQE